MIITKPKLNSQVDLWQIGLSRRMLLRGLAATAGAAMAGKGNSAFAQLPRILYEGTDLTGWTMTVGDGIYAAPDEAPVSTADIETSHYATHSELRANLHRRQIMAHNLMYKKIIDPAVLDYIHFCSYEFRLPFIPTKGNSDLNAQTLEGGVALWDGATSRLNYNVAFQWGLNPYRELGALRVWTSIDNGSWQQVGLLPVDTEWHHVQFMLDYPYASGALSIDGKSYLERISINPGPTTWGKDISVTMGAEIISIYPGAVVTGALHMAEFRHWRWEWIPGDQARTFLPLVAQG